MATNRLRWFLWMGIILLTAGLSFGTRSLSRAQFAVTATPTEVSGTLVPAAFQTFERGIILWRRDTGAIIVLANDGTAQTFTVSAYADLPDNAQPDHAPSDPRRPIFGIGKVWGNFDDVRSRIGMPTAGERAFTTTVYPTNGATVRLDHPNGHSVDLLPNGTWRYTDGTPITEVGTIPATYQPFEGGIMIWNAETGDIYVYTGEAFGTLAVFPAENYGNLPFEVVLAPDGLLTPLMGFGRVWANFGNYRDVLGWATAPEISYLMNVERDGQGMISRISLPNGRMIDGAEGEYSLPGGLPTQLPPTLAAFPITPTAPISTALPTLMPTSALPTVQTAFQCFENGAMIWRADTGMVYALQPQGDLTVVAQPIYEMFPNPNVIPPNGLFAPISAFGKVWGNMPAIRSALGWATRGEQGHNAVISSSEFSSSDWIRIGIPGGGAVDVNPSAGQWSYPSLGDTANCP